MSIWGHLRPELQFLGGFRNWLPRKGIGTRTKLTTKWSVIAKNSIKNRWNACPDARLADLCQIAWTPLLSESPYCLAFDPSRSIRITIAVWATLKVLCCAAQTIVAPFLKHVSCTNMESCSLFPLLQNCLFVLNPNIRPSVLALLLFC